MPRVRTLTLVAVLAAVPALAQPPAAPNLPAVARPAGKGMSEPVGRMPRPSRPAAPPPAGSAKLDRHGDPMPAGAIARFGSVRLRHGGALSALAFTQDAKYVISISATDEGFRLWEAATGKEVARLNTAVATAAIAPDRSVLYAADGKARVWEPLAGRVRELPPGTLPDAGVSALAVHPGGKLFAAAVPAGIAVIDLATGDRKAELRVPGDQPPQRIVFSPDGRWVAAAGPRTGVWLWNLSTQRRVRTYPTGQGDHLDFAFSPDGNRLVVAGGPLAVFHTDSEEVVEGFTPPDAPVFAARFSADGKSLFALQQDGSLARLDAATGAARDAWAAPEGVAAQPPVVVAADGAWVAAMDDTGGIRVWNPRDGTGPAVERLTALSDPGFTADGKVASALTEDGRVVLFDPATGAPGKTVETGLTGEGEVFWNARAGLAAGLGKVGDDAELHVVDVANRKVVARLPLPAGDLPWVAFSPSDSTRVALFLPASVAVYDTLTGAAVRTFEVGQPEGPKQGALSPDGRLVAVTTSPVTVWEVTTGRKRFEFAGLDDPQGVTFSADGRLLAAADATGVVVSDLRSGGVVRRIRAPGGDPLFTCVAFSPDGTKLATGGADGVVVLWDVGSGEALVAFDRHEGPVTGAAFSADGRRILTTSLDGTALVWDATARPAVAAAVAGADEAFGLLGSPDPAVAHRGMAYLLRTPDASVKVLADRIAVPAAAPADRIARLVAELGSPEFPARQAAVRDLAEIGPEAGPALRRVVATPPNPEVRRLAGDLLNRLAAPPTCPDDLRAIRAVEVLEGIATAAAREVLTRWAAGPAHHRLTTEAAAAVRRLGAVP